jgi:hypothetical protein
MNLTTETTSDETGDATLAASMQIRFDKQEMDSFYDRFDSMDIQSCLDTLLEEVPSPEPA